jgi:hypothetical protein
MAIHAELLREDMRLKTPVGVFHTALEATENSMNSRQGKRLRAHGGPSFGSPVFKKTRWLQAVLALA